MLPVIAVEEEAATDEQESADRIEIFEDELQKQAMPKHMPRHISRHMSRHMS